MRGKGLGCGEQGLSNGEVWAVCGANAQDPQGWKRPWGLWQVGLRLKEQKGPRHAPHPWSQRTGDLTWEPSRLPGLEWAGQMPSSPLQLLCSGGWEGLSRLPLLIPPASFLCPQGPTAWRGRGGRGISVGAQQAPRPKWARQSPSAPLPLLPGGPSRLPLLISLASLLCPQDPCSLDGALEGGGTGLGAQQAPRPEWAGQSPSAPLLPFPESPSHLPLLISPASGVQILSGLHFSSHLGPPTSYWFTLGFIPSPWGSESPTRGWQGP